jgi:hypothetical protein
MKLTTTILLCLTALATSTPLTLEERAASFGPCTVSGRGNGIDVRPFPDPIL